MGCEAPGAAQYATGAGPLRWVQRAGEPGGVPARARRPPPLQAVPRREGAVAELRARRVQRSAPADALHGDRSACRAAAAAGRARQTFIFT